MCVSRFSFSPRVLFPKLSEGPYWNSSAQAARGLREGGGNYQLLSFHSTDWPQPPKGSGSSSLDPVEISLGKSHKPVRNLTSFAFSDWITDRLWFSPFPLRRKAQERRKAKLSSIFRRNVVLWIINLVVLPMMFPGLDQFHRGCVSVSCCLKIFLPFLCIIV